MGNFRAWEWVIILALVVLLFGARKLPDLARSVGKSMKIFKSEVKDLRDDPDAPSTTSPAAPSTETTDDGEPRQP